MRPQQPLWIAAALTAACGAAHTPPPAEPVMNESSKPYVMLVLGLGQTDPSYVDAYYGPPEWQKEAEAQKPGLPQIRSDAQTLLARLRALAPETDEMGALRHRFLVKQIEALIARVDMLQGRKMTFDQESKALYDAVAPVVTDAQLDETLAKLETLIPGTGPLQPRLEALRKSLIIPADKLDAVFQAAIAECKARTVKHIELPAGESFTVEYVKDKPWSGYNWYKGGFKSVIQVNTDLPIYIDRAIDLACHEGYPGHHVYNLLLEKRLVRDRGWQELTVYPLYSPMSLIAEGSANYGIDVAFPGEERAAFEAKVLYPLAGLDPSLATRYDQILEVATKLTHATNQAARNYLDGKIDAAAAEAYLVKYSLMEPARAKKYISFIDANRSYVINYNLGQDLVKAWVERQGGDPWKALEKLLSSPMLASDLVK